MEYHLHKPVKEPLLFGEQQRLIMVQWRNYDMTTMLFCLNNNPILFRYWGEVIIEPQSLGWRKRNWAGSHGFCYSLQSQFLNSYVFRVVQAFFLLFLERSMNIEWNYNYNEPVWPYGWIISLQTNGMRSPRVKAANIFRKSDLLSSKGYG